MSAVTALMIPVEGPVQSVVLDGTLAQLQALVGGHIEALPVPSFIDGRGRATAYVNADGKCLCPPNMRATDFMVPGVGLFFGDYVAGPMLVCGFNPRTGEHAKMPTSVEKRVRLIEQEAG
jgi:hypothetical protein